MKRRHLTQTPYNIGGLPITVSVEVQGLGEAAVSDRAAALWERAYGIEL